MENKKNTKFIVIAIVAALVFAAGVTYAYFAASGEVELSMDITNDVMQQSEGKNDYSVYESDGGTFTVSLTAGSGTATCSYDLAITSEGDQYTKSTAAGSLLEYTIKGSDGTQSFAEKNIDTALATNNGVQHIGWVLLKTNMEFGLYIQVELFVTRPSLMTAPLAYAL